MMILLLPTKQTLLFLRSGFDSRYVSMNIDSGLSGKSNSKFFFIRAFRKGFMKGFFPQMLMSRMFTNIDSR